MHCELCGKTGELYKTEIEGTIITTCNDCKKFGKTIKKLTEEKKTETKKTEIIKTNKPEIIETITKNYSTLIKNAREKLGLTQKEFAKKLSEKESNIHAIESGKREPNIATAKKIEKQLGIKLIETHVDEDFKIKEKIQTNNNINKEFTLGDFIVVKKRKQ